jgi:thioredoxin 1
MMADVKYVTEDNFESEVLQSELPTLVDFTAIWCGPCKMLAPLIDELAEEWDGRVNIYKMDVDTNPTIPVKYDVMGVPSLILFKNGNIAARITGFRPKKQLVTTFEPHF